MYFGQGAKMRDILLLVGRWVRGELWKLWRGTDGGFVARQAFSAVYDKLTLDPRDNGHAVHVTLDVRCGANVPYSK
jgi:hypothetical protein